VPLYWFVVDEFPTTPSGKVQKFLLPRRGDVGNLEVEVIEEHGAVQLRNELGRPAPVEFGGVDLALTRLSHPPCGRKSLNSLDIGLRPGALGLAWAEPLDA
jgi:hypothetical protein